MVFIYSGSGLGWSEPPYSKDEQESLEERLYEEAVALIPSLDTDRWMSDDHTTSDRYLSLDDRALMNLGECIRGYVDAQDVPYWFRNRLPLTVEDAECLCSFRWVENSRSTRLSGSNR